MKSVFDKSFQTNVIILDFSSFFWVQCLTTFLMNQIFDSKIGKMKRVQKELKTKKMKMKIEE